jgi:hypothetical protein
VQGLATEYIAPAPGLPLPGSGSTTRSFKEEHVKIWCDHLDAGVIPYGNRPPQPRRRIAYYKIGRSLLLDPKLWGPVGGDNEAPAMLFELARRYPEVDWVVTGRHDVGDAPLPPNIIAPELPIGIEVAANIQLTNELYASCDGAVLWLGQHGTTNMPTPQLNKPDIRTFPLDESLIYVGPTFDALNRIGPPADGGYEPAWLCADPRNYLKSRDIKWYPNAPILGQYDMSRDQRHFRWYDTRTPEQCGASRSKDIGKGHWSTEHSYIYSGLELTGVPRWEDQPWPDFEDRVRFGVIINENRAYVTLDRASITRDWIVPCEPDFLHGKWSPKGMELIGREVESVHYTQLHDVFSTAKSTFTTPASGSRWATAKPWESFALGVICFFHPFYDDQGHIIPTLEQASQLGEDDELRLLAWWLRPKNPDELKLRVDRVNEDRDTYLWLRDAQLRRLESARMEDRIYRNLTAHLGLEYRPS